MSPDAGAGIAAAKDLTAEAPHALDADLEGYAWLPRMLDKARATLAGSEGVYAFGCPVDHTCMARLGVMPERVLSLAARFADDRAVLDELREDGIPDSADAWFDGAAVEDELERHDRYLRVRRPEQLPPGPFGRVFAGGEHGARASVALVELAPDESEETHEHATEEVIAVQAGAATYFLGERQARIVRAGEVVRVPAFVAHRAQNAGAQPFRAVSAFAARRVDGIDNRTMPAATVIPSLPYPDVEAAMDWLGRAFGFRLRWRAAGHRAQLAIGDGAMVVVEGATDAPAGATGPAVLVRVDDVDAHHARAREAGATILTEPADFPYGERQYGALDLAGHRWTFSQSIADVPPESWGAISG